MHIGFTQINIQKLFNACCVALQQNKPQKCKKLFIIGLEIPIVGACPALFTQIPHKDDK